MKARVLEGKADGPLFIVFKNKDVFKGLAEKGEINGKALKY